MARVRPDGVPALPRVPRAARGDRGRRARVPERPAAAPARVRGLLSTLAPVRGRRCLIALEDVGSESILPLLEGVAALALPVVDRGRPRRPSPRERLARADRPHGAARRTRERRTGQLARRAAASRLDELARGAADRRSGSATTSPRRLDQRATSGSGSRPAARWRTPAASRTGSSGAATRSTSSRRSPSRTSVTASIEHRAEPPTDVRPSERGQLLPLRRRRCYRRVSRARGAAAARVRLPATLDPQPRRRPALPRARCAARRRVQRLRGLGRATLGPAAALRAARRAGRGGAAAARPRRRHGLGRPPRRAARARRRGAPHRHVPELRRHGALRPSPFRRVQTRAACGRGTESPRTRSSRRSSARSAAGTARTCLRARSAASCESRPSGSSSAASHFLLVGDGLRMPEVEEILGGTEGAVPHARRARPAGRRRRAYLAASDLVLSPHVPNEDGSPLLRLADEAVRVHGDGPADRRVGARSDRRRAAARPSASSELRRRRPSAGRRSRCSRRPAASASSSAGIRRLADDRALARRARRERPRGSRPSGTPGTPTWPRSSTRLEDLRGGSSRRDGPLELGWPRAQADRAHGRDARRPDGLRPRDEHRHRPLSRPGRARRLLLHGHARRADRPVREPRPAGEQHVLRRARPAPDAAARRERVLDLARRRRRARRRHRAVRARGRDAAGHARRATSGSRPRSRRRRSSTCSSPASSSAAARSARSTRSSSPSARSCFPRSSRQASLGRERDRLRRRLRRGLARRLRRRRARSSGATRDSRSRPSLELLVVGFRYATKSYLITLLAFVALRGKHLPAAAGVRPCRPRPLLDRDADRGRAHDPAAGGRDDPLPAPRPRRGGTLGADACGRRSGWPRSWSSSAPSTAVFAGPVIRLLYGEEFAPSTRVLQIMLPSVFSLAVAGVLSQYLAAIGLPRPLLGVWARRCRARARPQRRAHPGSRCGGAAAALSIGHAAVLCGVIVVAYAYRSAPPGGPKPLDERGLYDAAG